MSIGGPDWFFWMVSGTFGTVVAFIVFRILFKKPIAKELEMPYAPFPARAGAFAIELLSKPVSTAKRSATVRKVATRRHRARPAASSDPSPTGDDVPIS
jgi:hypothetical protein